MTPDKILAALSGTDDEALFRRADAVRRRVFGSRVFIRAIVEFSNVCDKHCAYCGLRADNAGLTRYRMAPDEILAAAHAAVDQGAGTIVLQSGDDMGYDAGTVAGLIRAIKARHDVAVTLSLGDRGLDEYALWRSCGADRCLVKLETTDPKFYAELRRGEDFRERLRRVTELRRMGYEIGSGVIAGLPGTTLDDALRDVLYLCGLAPDMIAVGPFVPNPDTPLADAAPGSVELSLRMTAVLRILNPDANIPATSALDALAPDGRALGLARGCNVLMPSMTPGEHRGDYTIYPGKNAGDMDGLASLAAARRAIRTTGFVPSTSKGFSPRSRHV